MKTYCFDTAEELQHWALLWGKHAPYQGIITLEGPIGAGKTTWVQGFLKGAGYEGRVRSPTYTLVEEYTWNDRRIYHFDFYRLEEPIQCAALGLEDYFAQPALCLIEWPDHALGWLPPVDLNCNIKILEQGRLLECTALTAPWRTIEGIVYHEFDQN